MGCDRQSNFQFQIFGRAQFKQIAIEERMKREKKKTKKTQGMLKRGMLLVQMPKTNEIRPNELRDIQHKELTG